MGSTRAIGRSSLGLGPFLNDLESRLRALSADEMSAALLAHAECLPARERASFLEIFASSEQRSDNDEDGETSTAAVAPTDAADMLLADIDAFVKALGSGAYVEGWGWDEDLHDERSFGDESWADEMDDLLTGAATAFLDGDLGLARMAYEPLLKAFERHPEGFCGPEEPEGMLATDVLEAKARYLRAVYETTPLPARADALFEEMGALRYVGGEASLRPVADARRATLPDLEAFLPAWIAQLGWGTKGDSAPGDLFARDITRLRSEAAEWRGGADALAELAREPGSRDAEIHHDWVGALSREGRGEDAAAAAREALERLEPRGSLRAGIAERLARLAAAQGDGDAVLEARRESWRSAPSTRRVVELIDTATALGVAERVLNEEADWATQAPSGAERHDAPIENDRLACELLLLAGRIESAVERLSAAPALGWSARDHPGPIVFPYLLVAATGMGGPPEQEESLLAQAFEQIDVHGWVDAGDYLEVAFDAEIDRSLIDSRFRSIDRDELLPSFLLAGRLARRRSSAAESARWLSVARRAVEERVAAVVDAKHRAAYQRVARMAVACAEAVALAEEQSAGAAWLDGVRARYPRHYAFRAEVDAAARESPFLPSPIATRRR